MYKQLEIQQYLLLYYYTSSQFCKNYNTGILYIKRNRYSFSHDFFFFFFEIMIHQHGLLFFTLTRRFPIYHLSYWQCFLNVTAWRNWGKFCIPRGYLLSLGSNPLVNQDDRARLVVVIAQRLLRKMSYTLKRTEFASDGICYFCKWRCQENKS